LFQRRKEKRKSQDQTSGLRHRPPLREWNGLQAVVEEVVVERCVAEAEEELVFGADALAKEEPDRLRHSAPWQPEEEWDARKYPCLARNSARNNQIAFHSFFGHETSNDRYAQHVVLDVMGFR